ncbi:hypothetical protein BHE74_00036284 [Ensete ventricosum]|nr:hypothetical protein GW17_00013805 [Ensete ventricosum]RWW56949.1 hypothetical protein BHE74_00036284 [Ensete ventricosum]
MINVIFNNVHRDQKSSLEWKKDGIQVNQFNSSKRRHIRPRIEQSGDAIVADSFDRMTKLDLWPGSEVTGEDRCPPREGRKGGSADQRAAYLN